MNRLLQTVLIILVLSVPTATGSSVATVRQGLECWIAVEWKGRLATFRGYVRSSAAALAESAIVARSSGPHGRSSMRHRRAVQLEPHQTILAGSLTLSITPQDRVVVELAIAQDKQPLCSDAYRQMSRV